MSSAVTKPQETSFSSRRWLVWIGRILLIAITLFVIGWFAINLPPSFERFSTICSGDCPTFSLYPGAEEQLARIGMTPAGYGITIVTLDVLIFTIFVGMGLLVFYYRSHTLIGWLVAYALIVQSVGIPQSSSTLQDVYPTAFTLLLLLGTISFIPLIFLFPDGRFVPNWSKWAGLLLVIVTVSYIFTAILPQRPLPDWGFTLLFAAAIATLGAALYGQFVRYRRIASDQERDQLRWGLYGVIAFIASSLLWAVLFERYFVQGVTQTPVFYNLLGLSLLYLLGALFPLALGYAIFRHQFWQIELVINRTLVYGGLSLGIVFVYVLVVGASSILFQSQGSFLFALLATGLIAVLFQPVHARLQRAVNRLMFGERDDPYAVLSSLGRHLQETAVPGQILPAITTTITQTLKLPYAAIELETGAGERQQAAASGQAVGDTEEWPLIYQGETIGWLLVAPRTAGKAITGKERQLLNDIAAQAGAAAYSERLTTALQKSRERLVLAREEERRRIRRDLHDELGPSLASQTFKLDAALDLLQTDPRAAADLLNGLKTQNQGLVGDIRRLVYELRPPALDELGLMGALQAHTGQIDAPEIRLTAVPDPLPPLPAAVEVAAYRITLEATTNVVRHAQAQICAIQLETTSSHLTITIRDDGRGLPEGRRNGVGLTSMHERAEELGGELSIQSLAGGGTRVTTILPI